MLRRGLGGRSEIMARISVRPLSSVEFLSSASRVDAVSPTIAIGGGAGNVGLKEITQYLLGFFPL